MSITVLKKILRFGLTFMIATVVIATLFAGTFPWFYKQFDHQPLGITEYSPDQSFRLEVYAIPFLPFRPHYFIGMGCMDCPGYVRLVDNNNGEILAEKYFHMRQNLSLATWEKDQVTIKLFANWALPQR